MSDPTLMETVKERLATKYGDKAVVKIDANNPNQGEIVFKDGKGTVRGSLSTQGNSVTMKFEAVLFDMDPQRVKTFDSYVKSAFDRPPLGVSSSDIQGAARAEMNQSITTRLQASEIETAKASVVEQRAKVQGVVGAMRDQQAMRANGIAEHHIEAQTNQTLARLDAKQDPRSLLTAPRVETHLESVARTGQEEFRNLIQAKPAAAPVSSVYKPQLPAGTSPELAALLNRGYTPTTTPAQISNEPIHVRSGSGVNIGGVAAEVPTELAHGAGHAPASIGAGMRQAGKAQVGLLAAVAVGTGVVVTGKALYDGVPAVQAAALGAVATAESLPVVKPIREGRYAEAAAQVFSVGLGVAAAFTTGISGGTSWAAAAGIEETVRAGMRYAGMEVDKGMIRNVMATMAQAVEKTIPMAAMQTNVNTLRTQENLLKDAGLTDFKQGDKTISPAALLREPNTRDAYLTALKDSLAKEKDPKAHDQLAHQVEAASKFVEIEGRRVAKLEPYMKEVESKLAATMKVQHLAGQFRQENVVPDITVASNGAATRAPQQQSAAVGRG